MIQFHIRLVIHKARFNKAIFCLTEYISILGHFQYGPWSTSSNEVSLCTNQLLNIICLANWSEISTRIQNSTLRLRTWLLLSCVLACYGLNFKILQPRFTLVRSGHGFSHWSKFCIVSTWLASSHGSPSSAQTAGCCDRRDFGRRILLVLFLSEW